MGKPSAPTPPDPRETAAAQTGTNVSTAIANSFLSNVNRDTPDGRVTYRPTGSYSFTDPTTGATFDIPTFTEKVRLDKMGRKTNNQNDQTQLGLSKLANQQTQGLRRHMKDPLDLSGLPAVRTGNRERKRVEQALFDRMQPQIDADRENLETMLANRGLDIGSDAYGTAQDNFGRNVNDARLGAIINAGVEQDRAFNQSMGRRSQAIDERLLKRNQPINEITALLSGSQVTAPQTTGGRMGQIPTTDYAGLVDSNYRSQLGAYGQDMGYRNQLMGGLFGLGAAGIRAYPF
jgi:hypothetical protein